MANNTLPIDQMSKLRLREAKFPVKGHRDDEPGFEL